MNKEGLKVVSESEHGNYKVVVYERETHEHGFEVGKWYSRHDDYYVFIHKVDDADEYTYYVSGFNEGVWHDKICADLQFFKPADMEEVEKLMIAEAKKLGYDGDYLKIKLDADILNVYEDNHEEFYTIWSARNGWNGRSFKTRKETPALEEVQEKYPVGTRFISFGISKNEFTIKGSSFIHESTDCEPYENAWRAECVDQSNTISVWSPSVGWAEIITPLFTNSHKSKFYKDSRDMFFVRKVDNKIVGPYRKEDKVLSYEDSVNFTETLTLQEAEQYVLDNRVFEDGAHYRAVYKGGNTTVQCSGELFYLTGVSGIFNKSVLDSIGLKITF